MPKRTLELLPERIFSTAKSGYEAGRGLNRGLLTVLDSGLGSKSESNGDRSL